MRGEDRLLPPVKRVVIRQRDEVEAGVDHTVAHFLRRVETRVRGQAQVNAAEDSLLVVEGNVVRLNPFFYKPEHRAEIELLFSLSRRFVHAFMNQRVTDGEEGKA